MYVHKHDHVHHEKHHHHHREVETCSESENDHAHRIEHNLSYLKQAVPFIEASNMNNTSGMTILIKN